MLALRRACGLWCSRLCVNITRFAASRLVPVETRFLHQNRGEFRHNPRLLLSILHQLPAPRQSAAPNPPKLSPSPDSVYNYPG